MTVTLAKALKMRSRLVKDIRDLEAKLARHNVFTKGIVPDVDTSAVYEDLTDAKADLVTLKMAIYTANAGIQEKIFEMSEIRSTIQTLQGMDTDIGEYKSFGFRYDADEKEYESTLDNEFVDTEVKVLQNEADTLQDELDAYNHATVVDLPDYD